MANNYNSASRLHDILSNTEKAANRQLRDHWAVVFSIGSKNRNQQNTDVVERLGLLDMELEAVENFIKTTTLDKDLYEKQFAEIRKAINTSNLTASWFQLKGHLSPEVLLSLHWCSELMPNEKDQLSKKDLNNITDQVLKLKELLEKSNIPPSLKSLIEKHLEIIEKAIRSYDLIGVKAFRNAIYESHADFSERDTIKAEDLKSDDAKKGVKLLFNILGKIRSTPGVIVDVDRVLGAGIGIADNANKIYEWYKLVSPPGE